MQKITAENKAAFPPRLREVLALRKMTQEHLSELCHISKSSMTNYVSGEHFPRDDTLMLIAETLSTNVGYLIGEKDCPLERTDPKAIAQNAKMTNFAFWARKIKEIEDSTPGKRGTLKAEFNARMRMTLIELGWKQSDLLERIHIYFPKMRKDSLSQYIKGKYLPPTEKLLAIARALQKHPLWLIGLEYEYNPDMENDDIIYSGTIEDDFPVRENAFIQEETQDQPTEPEQSNVSNIPESKNNDKTTKAKENIKSEKSCEVNEMNSTEREKEAKEKALEKENINNLNKAIANAWLAGYSVQLVSDTERELLEKYKSCTDPSKKAAINALLELSYK